MKYVNIEEGMDDWLNPNMSNNYVDIEHRNNDIFILESVSIPGFGDYCANDKYFNIDNALSELTTEELRSQARTNLDISWKNLLGNIELAPGLKDFILAQLDWNNLHGELNPIIVTTIKEQIADLTNYWELIE